MDIFDFRNHLIDDYSTYIKSFINIRDERIDRHVQDELSSGVLWPEPLIQLNPAFEPGGWITDLVAEGLIHPECERIFQRDKPAGVGAGKPLRLHRHQADAIRAARTNQNYVLTTGTGSGKSLAYIIPIVDHVLRRGSGRGIQAIVVYPMNALANSQEGELRKFLKHGYPDGRGPVTFARYTGQENDEARERIRVNPPDIILTNYVMLELILTNPVHSWLVEAARGLRFLVLDELHTYRGRQGADVALLVRRTRDRLAADKLQYVGTSATLVSEGSFDEQRVRTADAATRLFGAEVKPEGIIGETLRRATPERNLEEPAFKADLTHRVADRVSAPATHEDFIADPLSIWIESMFGVVRDTASNRLKRAEPLAIQGEDGAAQRLADLTDVPIERCVAAIQARLMAGFHCTNPETGFPVFAFRLHQFISRGDTVYASLADPDTRYITVNGQRYVPGQREHVLLPLAFCRECGHEYYVVRGVRDGDTGRREFVPRAVGEIGRDNQSEPGFLYLSSENPWPDDADQALNRLPDEWVEETRNGPRVLRDRRQYVPQPVRVRRDGREGDDGEACHFIPAPFRFCLNCGAAYDFRQKDDFAKLATLSSEGRSTATTILSLSAVRHARHTDLDKSAQKLLSFTDNRQDASLQSGHFNDFIEIGLLRAALYQAVSDAGSRGVRHENLTQRVFDALRLPFQSYASNPEARFAAKEDTNEALREVLGYRLYHDLRRGWRLTSPNLEQCDLLDIRYRSLDEVCEAEDVWAECHGILVAATPQKRYDILHTLLDVMRRSLAIKVNYLDKNYQEKIRQTSSQRLIEPWAIDENERMDAAGILYPRSRKPDDDRRNAFLSGRSQFAQYLRSYRGLRTATQPVTVADSEQIIRDLLKVAVIGGQVEVVDPGENGAAPGYQLVAATMLWTPGKGEQPEPDPLRVTRISNVGAKANPFFVDFYRSMAADLQNMQAREHTAQVPSKQRENREDAFRMGSQPGGLPILYCSPTMELGVDIADLNLVNMRNVPPTPANYAQRSGRAGRHGQPALVFTYCTTGSPHDQYFFRRPRLMVGGSVAPPRLDLANRDLVSAHLHAIWLAETHASLGWSLKDILDLTGDPPVLQILESKAADLTSPAACQRAIKRGHAVLKTLEPMLQDTDWYADDWIEKQIEQAFLRLDAACNRWRDLYRAALAQQAVQNAIIVDATKSVRDKDRAKALRAQAEEQMRLLTEIETLGQSDFFSYRYFASEGFLPGYSFPRLPLSAYIPARRKGQREEDEYLSRPRFLAISEFGPGAIVYHEGSRYVINQVILPPARDGNNGGPVTERAKRCPQCGYQHPIDNGDGVDLCERCGASLDRTMRPLFRLQNVSTRRRDRITSDEEERMRKGFEIITGIRFAYRGGQLSCQTAGVARDEAQIAALTYASQADLWRINLGWSRRQNHEVWGFPLNMDTGYWAKDADVDDEDLDDPDKGRYERVIPYVQDRRNALLFQPMQPLSQSAMASLQAALKNAIQVVYQLEDGELGAEPLPQSDDRRQLLFYEAAEGGAGVLRRLVEDTGALARVAREALQLCHFDPESGADLHRAPGAREDCAAACYNCLMSYNNQRDHALLDRYVIKDVLLALAQSDVSASPTASTRDEHVAQLKRLAGSGLEREWLDYLDRRGYRLPSHAQRLIESCSTKPDFYYSDTQTAVYIDGPSHDYPDRQARDTQQLECMEDLGYMVVRFGYQDDWDRILAENSSIFGRPE